jgi:type VI secretion system protein ImpM
MAWGWPFWRHKQAKVQKIQGGLPGFFGKSPDYADFFCRRLPHSFVDSWYQWLSKCLESSQNQLGEEWPTVYEHGSCWHFALSPGLCGQKSWIGLVLPSTDKSGRNFPFTLAAEWSNHASFPSILPSLSDWSKRAEQTVRYSLEQRIDLDEIDVRLAQLGPPSSTFSKKLNAEHCQSLSLQGLGVCRVDPQVLGNSTEWPYFSLGWLADMQPGHSAWWTTGSERVSPSLLICHGLLPTEGFAALLDGLWSERGWQTLDYAAEPSIDTDDESESTTWTEIQSDNWHWKSASVTHQGNRRAMNEDACLERSDIGLWAVADGMGGHEAGEVASQRVVDSLGKIESADTLDAMLAQVEARLVEVNDELQAMGSEKELHTTPGSTVVVMLAVGNEGACLWAGDSRAYRYHDGTLEPLTHDHSRVGDMLREGILSIDEARNHPAKNKINRAVGITDHLVLDTVRFDIQNGDVFLLCSDGLSNELNDVEIAAILSEGKDSTPEVLCENLLTEVLGREGRDNVSVVVVVV